MIYKFQTSRSIWKSKAYKSYLWASFKNDCLLFKRYLLLSLWIVRQENQSSLRSSPRVFFLLLKNDLPYVCFFLSFFICIIIIIFFLKTRLFRELPLFDPFSLFIIFFKLIFNMNLPKN